MEVLGCLLNKLTVLAGLKSFPMTLPLSYFKLTVLESNSLSLGLTAFGGRLPRYPAETYLFAMSYLSYF